MDYPPLGFTFSDFFSSNPDAVQRVLSSPYFIYLVISGILLGVLMSLLVSCYRSQIITFLDQMGLTGLSDFIRQNFPDH